MCAYSSMQQPKMNNCMQENRRTGPPNIWLPPGFRFHPTDDELITFYLIKKVLNNKFVAHAIAEVDLNKYEPWDLPERANMGEKEWYFFSLRDRKYPTGMRTNRATEAGYWKATGKDRDIRGSSLSGYSNSLVGMKKTLVFYRGRAPRGEKTNWVMHEYRLEGKTAHLYGSRSSKEEWVVCRIFQKKALTTKLKLGNAFGEDAQDSDVPSSPAGVKQEHEKPCAEPDTQACTDLLNYEENWNTKGGNYGIYGSGELARLLDPEFLPALRSNHGSMAATKAHENSCLRGLTRLCKNEPHIEANTYEFQYGSSQNQHLDIPSDQALLNELLLNRFLVDPSAASAELDQLYAF